MDKQKNPLVLQKQKDKSAVDANNILQAMFQNYFVEMAEEPKWTQNFKGELFISL